MKRDDSARALALAHPDGRILVETTTTHPIRNALQAKDAPPVDAWFRTHYTRDYDGWVNLEDPAKAYYIPAGADLATAVRIPVEFDRQYRQPKTNVAVLRRITENLTGEAVDGETADVALKHLDPICVAGGVDGGANVVNGNTRCQGARDSRVIWLPAIWYDADDKLQRAMALEMNTRDQGKPFTAAEVAFAAYDLYSVGYTTKEIQVLVGSQKQMGGPIKDATLLFDLQRTEEVYGADILKALRAQECEGAVARAGYLNDPAKLNLAILAALRRWRTADVQAMVKIRNTDADGKPTADKPRAAFDSRVLGVVRTAMAPKAMNPDDPTQPATFAQRAATVCAMDFNKLGWPAARGVDGLPILSVVEVDQAERDRVAAALAAKAAQTTIDEAARAAADTLADDTPPQVHAGPEAHTGIAPNDRFTRTLQALLSLDGDVGANNTQPEWLAAEMRRRVSQKPDTAAAELLEYQSLLANVMIFCTTCMEALRK